MSVLKVNKTRLANGVWEGVISDVPSGVTPGVEVRFRDRPLEDIAVTPATDGLWQLKFSIPPQMVSDGIQTISILEQNTGEVIDSFAIIAGEVADETIRAEIDRLREELDLLKRAFRRHCVETA